MKILGVDEAGRGPVIGPLVICGAMIEENEVDKLVKLDVKDSKLLTAKKRSELFPKIKEIVEYKIIKVEPPEIDEALLSPTLNLNWLEAHKTAEIVNEMKPDLAIIDCPSPNKAAYLDYLKKLINVKCNFMIEHKAERFPIVAAASILAKVTRDNEIEDIKKKYGDIGPGYPANPITQKFLKENWDKHPEIFRKTWVTWKDHAKAKDQMKLKDY